MTALDVVGRVVGYVRAGSADQNPERQMRRARGV